MRNKFTFTLLFLLTIFTLLYIWLIILGEKTRPENNLFNLHSFTPLLGSFYGWFVAERWGGLKSVLGKAMSFFSLGLFAWSFGGFTWFWYTVVLSNPVPYPSFADAGFLSAALFWAVGMIYIVRACGIRFTLKNPKRRAVFIALTAGAAFISFLFFYRNFLFDLSDLTKSVLNLGYIVEEITLFIFGVIAIQLIPNLSEGKFRGSFLILAAGFVVLFAAQLFFAYETTKGTYYNGNFTDLLYAAALATISIGVARFYPEN